MKRARGLPVLGLIALAAVAEPGSGGPDRPPVAFDRVGPAIPEEGKAVVELSYADPDGDLASECSMTSSTIRFARSCECDAAGSCTVEVEGLPDATGPVSFDYAVTAKHQTSNRATVSIELLPVDDPMLATSFTHPAVAVNSHAVIPLPYVDPDDMAQSCSVADLVGVTLTGSCECTAGVCAVGITGLLDHAGPASFQFTVSDGRVDSLPATASLAIGEGATGIRIPAAGDRFGFSVAAFGDRFVVGAPGEGRIGAAYVYADPNGDGNWADRKLEARLGASDGKAGDYFGAVVAMDDGVVVVLEDTESWSATPNRLHVFVDSTGHGAWELRNMIERPARAGHFGGGVWLGPGYDALDIQGSRIVAGAFQDSAAGEITGAVYVFEDPDADQDWSNARVTRIEASDPQRGASFGISVALDGDVLVVGASDHASTSGAVYVYRHDGSAWVEEARIGASNPSEGLLFGSSVDIEGDTVIASSEGDLDPGAIYVIRRVAGQWVEQAQLRASNGEPTDRLGSGGIQLAGDTIFAATPFEDGARADPLSNDFENSGALYLFRDPDADGDWSDASEIYLKPQLPPSLAGETHDFFACSFGVAGSTLVVGAFDEDGDGGLPPNDALHDAGAAYLYIDPDRDGRWDDWLEHLYAK